MRPRDCVAANAALAALLRLGATDPMAARVALAALCPGLGAVAARLGSSSRRVGRDELEAVLIAAAWEQVIAMVGDPPAWPAALIVSRARDRARATLAADARYARVARRLAQDCERQDADPAEVVVRLADASAHLRAAALAPESLAVVVATRFLGVGLGELAQAHGMAVATARQRRWRAERALRAA